MRVRRVVFGASPADVRRPVGGCDRSSAVVVALSTGPTSGSCAVVGVLASVVSNGLVGAVKAASQFGPSNDCAAGVRGGCRPEITSVPRLASSNSRRSDGPRRHPPPAPVDWTAGRLVDLDVEVDPGGRVVVTTPPAEREPGGEVGPVPAIGTVPARPVSARSVSVDEGLDGRVAGIDGAAEPGPGRRVEEVRSAVDGGVDESAVLAVEESVTTTVVDGRLVVVVGGGGGAVVVGGGDAGSRRPEPGPDPLSAVPVTGPTRSAAVTMMSVLLAAAPVEARSTMFDWTLRVGVI